MVYLYVAFSEEYSCIHQGECVFASVEQFSTVLEIIRDCFGFAKYFLLWLVQKNSRYPPNQSDTN